MNERIEVKAQINKVINFAMQQNYVPVVRNLILKNKTEENMEHIKVKITFDPAFARDYEYEIQELLPEASVEIRPVKIQVSSEYLFSLTEKMKGTILVDIFEKDEKIYSFEDDIELLAYNEWSGLYTMPEIISAFITPNHPAVLEVISEATHYLEEWTKDPSFDGYISKAPNRVRMQMASIYTALKNREIVYNLHPASFEKVGQRVRLPYEVLEQKRGNCLDLSVLYASCLEAIGLHPLIVFVWGHAFTGCWLEEETFAECMIDDVAALQKRIAKGVDEIALVESTLFRMGANTDFDGAQKAGEKHLEKISDFQFVIDIKRTRGSGIRPIPLRITPEDKPEEGSTTDNTQNAEVSAPSLIDMNKRGMVADTEQEVTKQKLWERKLLDLSLKNTLLNFRVTKNAIQLMVKELGSLEDKLADGKDFLVLECPPEWQVSLRDAKMYEIENDKSLVDRVVASEFASGRIRTFMSAADLEMNLKSLHRNAKTSMEENGTNTLYLALGFLRWFETEKSERARYAPLVLIPVDIVRSMKNKGYLIRSRQEEAQINITLLEFLRQDFEIKISGLDPLPEDESGIDLPLIFNTIRQAVMGKARWNVEETAFLGLFSFGHFIMWNDIKNRADELKQNKVVSSLISGKLEWTPLVDCVTAEELDEKLSPDEMAIPVSADSSQMVAITAAAKGQSFVLHGPPGTGKSQTITNMIANALYQGKSVLFVAEKMAALTVVQKRLAAIGLEPFCLELHSNKTNKTTVLGQLERSLEVGRIQAPAKYDEEALKLHELRKQLNKVIESIHKKRDYGKSLYEAVGIYEENKEYGGCISIAPEMLNRASGENIDKWSAFIRKYMIHAEAIGVYRENPFILYEGTEYSLELRNDFRAELTEFENTLQRLRAAYAEVKADWGVEFSDTRLHVEGLIELSELLLNPAQPLQNVVKSTYLETMLQAVRRILWVGKEKDYMEFEYAKNYDSQILQYNAREAWQRWSEAKSSWFLPKFFKQNKLLKELKCFVKEPSLVTKENIEGIYGSLLNYMNLRDEIANAPEAVRTLLAEVWLGEQTPWKQAEESFEKSVLIQKVLAHMGEIGNPAVLDQIVRGLPGETVEKIQNVLNLQKKFTEQVEQISNRYHIRVSELDKSNEWLLDLQNLTGSYLVHLLELKEWVLFLQADQELVQNGLGMVSEAFKNQKVEVSQLQNAFEAELYLKLASKTIAGEPHLASFQGRMYEEMISEYNGMIERFQSLTIQELVAKLSAKVPVAGPESASSSEIGILKKAIKSNGRMLSIRKLFDSIPILLRRLCPCMLMSPISVAQYIDPSFPKFDLVIFDEASQLPTSEAVGTIARGENVVVVGDPKQLPPTSFFSVNRIDEENSDKEDMESLLDDCLAISMPQEYLKWHYRSRHESLIAYSNMEYYDNKLFTFPSPNDLESQVKLVQLDGYYDKGRTKQNLAEAEAVVEEIIRRLKDKELREESIGVVTFSSVQQHLIEDILMEEFRKYPELEEYDSKCKEPIFIKNLENVQGDERDVILFSVGYGPDKEGKVSMNFGPLNKDGGWRRLNVAISRARKQMIVYAVIRSDQIDLARTRSEGVAGLKGFLEFAARGKNVIVPKAGSLKKKKDSLAKQIAAALEKSGYQVHTNIGCSEYKMDLGVVNPKYPETYALGILLDGENCKEAKTARDRFVVQPGVLNGLGWRLVHVWSLDWLENQDKVLEMLKSEIEIGIEKGNEIKKQNKKKQLSFRKINPNKLGKLKNQLYVEAEIPVQGTADEYRQVTTRSKIREVVSVILDAEAPISHKLLTKKVLAAWGVPRSGAKIERTLERALGPMKLRTTEDERGSFYWKMRQDPETYDCYRVPEEGGFKRSMEDICLEEIVCALMEVLEHQISIPRTDLMKEVAKKFGYTRLSSAIERAVNLAIEKAVEKKGVVVSEDGDRISLGDA